ncbi:MAG: c-type cytochrome [Rhodomicrobium sp.]
MRAREAALGIAIFAIVFSPAAEAARRGGASKGALQAKIQYCTECHGHSGRGYRGYYPIPQLAGQQVQYLENQFKALSEHRRDNPVAKRFMVPVIASVDPGMRTAIAEYFNTRTARTVGGGPRKLVAQGKKIFEEGLPDENVPACSACHGADGKGSDMVPRIAGQMYAYLVAQLSGWGKGYRAKDPTSAEDENTMKPIASSMTKEQITAVSAYLSRLSDAGS